MATSPLHAPPGTARRHAPETAGEHLVCDVPRAHPEESADSVLARLAGEAEAGAVYVVDDGGRLLGSVPLARLVAAEPGACVGRLASPPPATVTADTDQERVASLALHRGMDTMPVVDARGRLIGIVPPLAMLRVLRREHVEDLHRLAGLRRETAQVRHALEEPPVRQARDRLPWLLLGLLGSTAATLVMARFEGVLQAKVAVAFFVPGIVYLADAIGTQTETVVVRGISLTSVSLPRLLWGEMRAGLLMGALLSVLVFPGVLLAFGDARLAGAVALAVLVAGTLATSVGLLFPWLLHRAGADPAFGSGPLATVVQDVLSLLVYLVVCTALL
ncbi:MAG TPA: magnesium transporter [Longimicrobium sp.]|nr:magnesium transporter [Longimicrobium sp.]